MSYEIWRSPSASLLAGLRSGAASPQPDTPKSLLRIASSTVNFKDLSLRSELDTEGEEEELSHDVSEGPALCRQLRVAERNKLIIILVGLPGRGKTFLCNKLKCYLNWLGHNTRHFNVGSYRRLQKGEQEVQTADFFDSHNAAGVEARTRALHAALDDLMAYLRSPEGQVAIFDATNSTNERRNLLRNTFHNKFQYLFIESICTDEAVLEQNYRFKMQYSPDYQGIDIEKSLSDFKARIRKYEEVYEPITDRSIHYIKLINMVTGRGQMDVNRIAGYLPGKIVFFLMQVCKAGMAQARRIWLTRHGQSQHNLVERIGGDPNLAPAGEVYANCLPEMVVGRLPVGPPSPDGATCDHRVSVSVWTSTLRRTIQTARYLPFPKLRWKALDEIHAGSCDGMTYREIAQHMPEEYAARKKDKLRYRYPAGESYLDVIQRLEPVVVEMEREKECILVVGHQAVLRAVLGYFLATPLESIPNLVVPLHTLVELRPRPDGTMEFEYFPMQEAAAEAAAEALAAHGAYPSYTDSPSCLSPQATGISSPHVSQSGTPAGAAYPPPPPSFPPFLTPAEAVAAAVAAARAAAAAKEQLGTSTASPGSVSGAVHPPPRLRQVAPALPTIASAVPAAPPSTPMLSAAGTPPTFSPVCDSPAVDAGSAAVTATATAAADGDDISLDDAGGSGGVGVGSADSNMPIAPSSPTPSPASSLSSSWVAPTHMALRQQQHVQQQQLHQQLLNTQQRAGYVGSGTGTCPSLGSSPSPSIGSVVSTSLSTSQHSRTPSLAAGMGLAAASGGGCVMYGTAAGTAAGAGGGGGGSGGGSPSAAVAVLAAAAAADAHGRVLKVPYGATPGGGGSEGGAGPDLYLSLQQMTHHLTTAQHNHNLRAMQHAQAQLRATAGTTITITPESGPFVHPLAAQPHPSQEQHQDRQQQLNPFEQQQVQVQGPGVLEALRALSLARECTLDPKAGLPCDPAAAGGGLPCMDPATGLPRVPPVATPGRAGGSGHASARVSLSGNLPLLGEGEGPEGAGPGAGAEEAAVAAAAVEFAGWSIAGTGERAESVQLVVRGRGSGQGQG